MSSRHQRRRIAIHLAIFLAFFLVFIQNTFALSLFDPGESDQAEIDQAPTDQSTSQPIPTTSYPSGSESNDERALKGTTPATYVMLDEAAPPPPDQLAEAVQAKEYDAWRERIGGEESELWLSFDQWRENYLATEREKAEQEKHRLAASRRNRSEKQKDSVKSNPDQSIILANVTESNAQNGSSIPPTQANERLTNVQIGSEDSNNAAESRRSSHDESTNAQKGNPDTNPEQPSSNGDIIPSDPTTHTPDQLSIPALGNPTDELANLKQRWNFASLDCAAVVHRSNQGAKFTSSILSEKKDRYMLSPCPTNSADSQFVVVELCEEIKIDTLVLANFEFFSRMFKRFNVRVSRNLNGGEDEWVDIGTFRARNIRGLQVFKTINPSGDARFFRYIRIDFVEYYGSEYYCPLSLLRVYGLTQMDDYVREEEELRKAREAETLLLQEGEEGEAEQVNEEVIDEKREVPSKEEAENTMLQKVNEVTPTAQAEQSIHQPNLSDLGNDKSEAQAQSASPTQVPSQTVFSVPDHRPISNDTLSEQAAVFVTNGLNSDEDDGVSRAYREKSIFDYWKQQSCEIKRRKEGSTTSSKTFTKSAKIHSTPETAPSKTLDRGQDKVQRSASNQPSPPSSSASSSSSSSPPTSSSAQTSSSIQQQPPQQSPQNQHQQQQQQQQHGGSESIYRTITKRLNMLEMNATLSLQYMDHSRHMLRETFGRMERLQQEKIGQMLGELNSSNWQQIENLKRRQQMDLQQALFEFDLHRQQTDTERRALLAQVHLLSNEIMLEKRFGIAQLALLLGLFVFMGLTRGSRAAAPLINQGISRLSRSSSFVPKYGYSRTNRRQLHDPARTMSMRSNSPSSSTLQNGHNANKNNRKREEKHERDFPTVSVYHKSPRSAYQRGFQNQPLRFRINRYERGNEVDSTAKSSTEKVRSNRPNMFNHAVRRPGGINAKLPLRRRGLLRSSMISPKEVPQSGEADTQWQSTSIMSKLIRRSSM